MTSNERVTKALQEIRSAAAGGAGSIRLNIDAAWALLEAIEKRAPETSGWQPIETAPKGGKWVLLWWPRITDCAVVGYYSHKDCWCSPIGSWEGYLEGENLPGPTHWQPLPLPVKTGEEHG